MRHSLQGWSRALLLALVAGGCSEAPHRPSIVLVSIDTLRADHLGVYGYERATSPFLDRWAARGIVFERAFTPAAWTLSAHMTMLTGLYPEQHGVVEGDLALAREVPLLAERLAGAGYRTIGLYQPSWVDPRHGFGRGFEVFRAHTSAEQAGTHLFEELAHVADEQPFFLFVHLFDVHSDSAERGTVYSSPEPFRELFVPGAAERLAGETYNSLKKRKSIGSDVRADLTALYDEGIRHVDSVLEGWFTRLEAEGRLADTLVIVTADHGEALAQRGRLGGHGGIRQEGLHVPLLVRLPNDERAGTRVAEVAHLIDLAPTVLAFAGLARDPDLPGRSLLAPLPPDRVVAGSNPPVAYALRWPEKWLLRGQKAFRVDLAADPLERADQPIERAQYEALRAELGLRAGTLHEGVPVEALSEADAQALRDLGYAGEVDEH
jgi:arylsulfatase A-like enzyme